MNVKCGGLTVGYHIGQRLNAFVNDTSILFCTTGILLEKLKSQGSDIFKTRSYILIDEVHERSIQNDLVLACFKKLKQKKRGSYVKIVLMSATANASVYEEYFSDLSDFDEDFSVATAVIKGFENQENSHKIEEFYLDEICALAKYSLSEKNDLIDKFNNSFDIVFKVDDQHFTLLVSLVCSIAEESENLDILVFLPTFGTINKCHGFLTQSAEFRALEFDVVALHSSLDVETTVNRIIEQKASFSSSRPNIYLATNIAESSVTLPDVGHVVDFCRKNQIEWDQSRQRNRASVIFVSVSEATQRRGRTGRTCDGKVYRMVPKSVFENFVEYEQPAIIRASLRAEVLLLCSCKSVLLRKPFDVLNLCLSPPDETVALEAMDYLNEIGAIFEQTFTKRNGDTKTSLATTLFGKVLSVLPLNIELGKMVVDFSCEGLMLEGAVLAAISQTSNKPIKRCFPDVQNAAYIHQLNKYKPFLSTTDPDQIEVIRHYVAYETFIYDYLNRRRLKKCLKYSSSESEEVNALPSEADMEKKTFLHMFYGDDVEQWCEQKHLSFNAVHACLETQIGCFGAFMKVVMTEVMCESSSRRKRNYDEDSNSSASDDEDSVLQEAVFVNLATNCKVRERLRESLVPENNENNRSFDDNFSTDNRSVVSKYNIQQPVLSKRLFLKTVENPKSPLQEKLLAIKHVLKFNPEICNKDIRLFNLDVYPSSDTDYKQLKGVANKDDESPFAVSNFAIEANPVKLFGVKNIFESTKERSTVVIVVCMDKVTPIELSQFLRDSKKNSQFKETKIHFLLPNELEHQQHTFETLAESESSELILENENSNFFGTFCFSEQCRYRIVWKASKDSSLDKVRIFKLFASIVAMVVGEEASGNNFDVNVIITMSAYRVDTTGILCAAWSGFFDLVSLMPYNKGSKVPDSVEDSDLIDLTFKLNNKTLSNAL